MTLKENVRIILEMYPDSRNSDNVLFQKYYVEFFDGSDSVIDFFEVMPALMSISRARREIQHDGEFKSNKRVEAERKQLEKEYHEKYSHDKRV